MDSKKIDVADIFLDDVKKPITAHVDETDCEGVCGAHV